MPRGMATPAAVRGGRQRGCRGSGQRLDLDVLELDVLAVVLQHQVALPRQRAVGELELALRLLPFLVGDVDGEGLLAVHRGADLGAVAGDLEAVPFAGDRKS